MAHYLIRNDKCPGLPHGDEDESRPRGYRFGHDVKRSHSHPALNRVNGYVKSLIEAIANAKLRRMRRELELRGIRLDQSDEAWIASSLRDTRRGE